MKYSSPKEYIRALDQVYFKYVSIPILAFFAYYVYFLRNTGRDQLFEPELKPLHIGIYIALWLIPIIFFIKKNSDIKKTVRLEIDFEKQMEVYKEQLHKKFLIVILLFILAVAVFAATNINMMSLPVWVMFILMSIDKPNIFKASKSFKFASKETYDAFLKDSWL